MYTAMACLHRPDVPAANNAGEQALPKSVVHRESNGGLPSV